MKNEMTEKENKRNFIWSMLVIIVITISMCYFTSVEKEKQKCKLRITNDTLFHNDSIRANHLIDSLDNQINGF